MPQCFAGSHGFLSQENRTEACLVVMLYVLVSHPRFVQLFLCLFYVILGFKQQGSFNKLRVFLFLIAWFY